MSTQRQLTQVEIGKLMNVPGDAFDQQQKSVDTQLEALDGYVKRAEKEAEKIK